MAQNHLVDFLYRLFDKKSDPRTENWTLLANPLPTLFLCLSYVYIVKYLGPRLMKNRKPLNIRWLMIFYNFSMVIFNLILFYYLGIYGWFGKYNYKCQPVDYSNSPDAIGMLTVTWWYYFSKMVDFTDTIFLVMRKKSRQISTLHVVHHGILPMSVWFGLKFTPGGHSTFFGFINCFVHALMYSYYGLAAIGPRMNKYLWWKKYLTTVQMIQFICIFVHSFQLLFRECDYPKGFVWWIGMHAVLFWFLFADFYKKSYSKQKTSKDPEEKIEDLNKKISENVNCHHHSNGLKNGFIKQYEHLNNNLNNTSSNGEECSANQGHSAKRCEEKKAQ